MVGLSDGGVSVAPPAGLILSVMHCLLVLGLVLRVPVHQSLLAHIWFFKRDFVMATLERKRYRSQNWRFRNVGKWMVSLVVPHMISSCWSLHYEATFSQTVLITR